jgi:hypothetical protein
MTTTGKKLNKIKTKQVYGFKKEQFNMGIIGVETTSVPTSGIFLHR